MPGLDHLHQPEEDDFDLAELLDEDDPLVTLGLDPASWTSGPPEHAPALAKVGAGAGAWASQCAHAPLRRRRGSRRAHPPPPTPPRRA